MALSSLCTFLHVVAPHPGSTKDWPAADGGRTSSAVLPWALWRMLLHYHRLLFEDPRAPEKRYRPFPGLLFPTPDLQLWMEGQTCLEEHDGGDSFGSQALSSRQPHVPTTVHLPAPPTQLSASCLGAGSSILPYSLS